jgi:hypothetical protein
VVQRYLATLGGKRRGVPLENVDELKIAISELRATRRYAERSSWRIVEEPGAYRRVSSIAA